MSQVPTWSSREEALILLNAYLDNELDAAAILDVERRMAADPALKSDFERLRELRAGLTLHMRKERASGDLRRRIAAIGGTLETERGTPAPRTRRTFDWRQMAAMAASIAILSSATTMYFVRAITPDSTVAALVAGHQRALLAATPFDVASEDRHTVKPWFDRKLALSPDIVDLADKGFALAGGRVDIVEGRPVPVMVYKRRDHLISVAGVPAGGPHRTSRPSSRTVSDGYTVLSWEHNGFRYSAISDVAEKELSEFVKLWQAAAQPAM